MALTKEHLKTLKVGDSLVMAHRPEYLRKGEMRCPHQVVVISVGRKYFSVTKPEHSAFHHTATRFEIADGRHSEKDFGGRYDLFDTMGDYNREIEAENAWSELRGYFSNRYSKPETLTTESIKEILAILNVGDTKQ